MYTVKFISHEDFDSLPYNKVATSIGVADRSKGIAYVRDTGNPIDIFTAYHELEHLKGDDLHEHESPGEDGVYYKNGFMSTALPIAASFIPGIGPVAGPALGMAMNSGGGKQSQQPQQGTMDQFNPQASMAQMTASPATSAVGGAGAGGAGGPMGQGTIDKVRQMMAQQNQSGYYAGRNAGGQ